MVFFFKISLFKLWPKKERITTVEIVVETSEHISFKIICTMIHGDQQGASISGEGGGHLFTCIYTCTCTR